MDILGFLYMRDIKSALRTHGDSVGLKDGLRVGEKDGPPISLSQ